MKKTAAPRTVSREDWLAALREVSSEAGPLSDANDPSVLTVRQYAELGSFADSTARKHLQALVARGRAERVMVLSLGASGIRRRASAYRLLPAKESGR